MKIRIVCLLVLMCIMIVGCNGHIQNDDILTSGSSKNPTDILPAISSSSQHLPVQNKMGLDLRQPNECMLFLEIVLSEIEIERGLKPHNILDYCLEYTVQNFKSKERSFYVFMVESGPGSQIYIIVNAETKEYRYFDVPYTYNLLAFDNEEANFACLSGANAQQFNNFPYQERYSYADNQWSKVHLPINNEHLYYKLGGNPASFGILDRIELGEAKARVVFAFDELLEKDPSLGSALPILHYWFDPIANKATLSFSGIEFANNNIISSLRQIPGITDAQITLTEVIDLEALAAKITKATQITFSVSDEYNLYGEYENTDWDPAVIENNEMSFWLWTEKK